MQYKYSYSLLCLYFCFGAAPATLPALIIISIFVFLLAFSSTSPFTNSLWPFMNPNWILRRMHASQFTTNLWPFMNQNWISWRMHALPFTTSLWPFMNQNLSLWRMSASPFTPRPLASYEPKLEFVKDETPTLSSPSHFKKSALILAPVPISGPGPVSVSVLVLILILILIWVRY